MKEEPRLRFLIVDDEQSIRRLCMTVGQGLNYVCSEAETAEAALELVETAPPDIVVTDLKLPSLSGTDLLRKIKETAAAHRSRHHDGARLDRIGRGGHAAGRVRLHRKAIPRGETAPAAAAHGGKSSPGHRKSVSARARERGNASSTELPARRRKFRTCCGWFRG